MNDAFDVAIEVTTLARRARRILRIAELSGYDAKGPRDIFTFIPEASGDGTFQASGAQPRAIADFAVRGVKLDPALFKRSAMSVLNAARRSRRLPRRALEAPCRGRGRRYGAARSSARFFIFRSMIRRFSGPTRAIISTPWR